LHRQSKQSILEKIQTYEWSGWYFQKELSLSSFGALEPCMSRNLKIALMGIGMVIICGLSIGGTYAIFRYFQVQTGSDKVTETPSTDVITENQVTETEPEPTITSPAEKLPFHSVVQITAQYEEDGEMYDGWTGSGSIITPDGLILTNAHVVLPDRDNPVDYLVISLTGNQDEIPTPAYYAEVVQADALLDLAVIQITTDLNGNDVDRATLNLPAVPIGDSDVLSLGDKLSILGYPGIGGETITLTSGEVSGFTGEAAYGNRAFIKTNAAISGGNSGGLAVNAQGELVGIPTQLGYGGDQEIVDCRVLADTNGDGTIDEFDSCIPTGGFINSLRPVNLALPFIEKARSGEIAISGEFNDEESDLPEELPDSETIVFRDDFSDPGSGWEEFSDEDGSAGYVNGKYQIEVTSGNMVRWGVSKNSFDDITMNAKIRVNHETGEGDFGFLCRYVDEQNFYALEISEDGYAAIWKLLNGEVVVLVDWEFVGGFSGSSYNVSASCIGEILSISLDGTELVSARDGDFSSGDIGLVAGTNSVENLLVTFDDLVIRTPSQ
jgi:S1-C subfamily serine protease